MNTLQGDSHAQTHSSLISKLALGPGQSRLTGSCRRKQHLLICTFPANSLLFIRQQILFFPDRKRSCRYPNRCNIVAHPGLVTGYHGQLGLVANETGPDANKSRHPYEDFC